MGFWGQIKVLKEGAVKIDQVLVYETASASHIVIQRELKQRTDHIVGVKRTDRSGLRRFLSVFSGFLLR